MANNEKNINSRIQHKHDVEANWLKAENFIPRIGELIIYDPDENYSYARFKIGDGETLVNNLPFGTNGFVNYDEEQPLTEEQQAQARANIGAGELAVKDQVTRADIAADVAYINEEDNENVENPDIEMSSIIVDSKLSKTSMNPVQNKVITEKINEVSDKVDQLFDEKITETDAVTLLADIGIIDPIVDKNGAVYVNKDGNIYSL